MQITFHIQHGGTDLEPRPLGWLAELANECREVIRERGLDAGYTLEGYVDGPPDPGVGEGHVA